jgi:hypothetical protein
MKITAAPSPRGTHDQRLFLFTARAAAPRSLRDRTIPVYCADQRYSHSIAAPGAVMGYR